MDFHVHCCNVHTHAQNMLQIYTRAQVLHHTGYVTVFKKDSVLRCNGFNRSMHFWNAFLSQISIFFSLFVYLLLLFLMSLTFFKLRKSLESRSRRRRQDDVTHSSNSGPVYQ